MRETHNKGKKGKRRERARNSGETDGEKGLHTEI